MLLGSDLHLLILILHLNKGINLAFLLGLGGWLHVLLDSYHVFIPAAVTFVTHAPSEGYGIRVWAIGRLLLSAQLSIARLAQPPGIVFSLLMVTICNPELWSSFSLVC